MGIFFFCQPASSVYAIEAVCLHYNWFFPTIWKETDNLPRVQQSVWGRAGQVCLDLTYYQLANTVLQNWNKPKNAFENSVEPC